MNKKTKLSLMLLAAACIVASESSFSKQTEQESISYAGETDYLPYLQIGGTRFFNVDASNWATETDLFLPIWQSSPSHLVFTQLRFYDRSGKPWEGNVHLGYRYLSSDETRLHGVYAAFDRKKTTFGNYFNQLTFGIETWYKNFFIGGNYYQPIGNRSKNTNIFDAQTYLQKLNDSFYRIMVTPDQHAEKPAGGADAEIGYEFTKGLIGYIGGYYFKAEGFNSVHGPKVKLSYDYSLDNGKRVFGILDKVGVEVGVQHDKPRGTVSYLNVRLQLGLLLHKKANLHGVARHMVDLIRRDVDIVTQEGSVGKGESKAVRTQDGREIVLVKTDGSGAKKSGTIIGRTDDTVFYSIDVNSKNNDLVFAFLSPHTGKEMKIDLGSFITQLGSPSQSVTENDVSEDTQKKRAVNNPNLQQKGEDERKGAGNPETPINSAQGASNVIQPESPPQSVAKRDGLGVTPKETTGDNPNPQQKQEDVSSSSKLDQDTAKRNFKYISASSYVENSSSTFLEPKDGAFHLVEIDSKKVLEVIKNKDKDVSKYLSVSKFGAIVDSNTGLRLVLLQDKVTQEYILAFGSTDSGSKIGEQYWYARWHANIAQYLGYKPEIYLQANKIAQYIKSSYNTEITLTGSSLGGALAVYAATMNGLPAKGFATPAFNPSLREDMNGKDSSKVINFITEGDWKAKSTSYFQHVGIVYQMNPFGGMDKHAHSLFFIAKKAYPDVKTATGKTVAEESGSKIIGALYTNPEG